MSWNLNNCDLIESRFVELRYPTSLIFHLSVFMPLFPYVLTSYLFLSVRTFLVSLSQLRSDIRIAWSQLPRWMSLRRRMGRSSAGCSGSAALRTAGRPTAWTALASTPTAASARTWRRCSHRSRAATELHAVLILMVHRNQRHWRFAVYPQMLNSIRDCFVTGKWEEGQDAATLLKEDGEWRRWKSESSNTEVFLYRQHGIMDFFKMKEKCSRVCLTHSSENSVACELCSTPIWSPLLSHVLISQYSQVSALTFN